MIGFKTGVMLHDLCSQMVMAHVSIVEVYQRRAFDCIITSGSDGKHSLTSLHYDGKALDYRTRHMTETQAIEVHAEVRKILPRDFDVILHERVVVDGVVKDPGHLHVEYQPRRPT